MSAIVQGHVGLNEPQERLVHDRGGLERVIAPLSFHVITRETAQLVINQRRQALQRLGVALAPLGQELREIGGD